MEPQPFAEFDVGNSSLNVPIELDQTRKAYISGRVNDGKQIRVLLDTGVATRLVLDQKAVEGSRLTLIKGYQAQGTGKEKTAASLAKDISLRISGLTFHHIDALVIPFWPADPGKEKDAYLGFYFYKDFVIEVDNVAKIINIYDPRVYNYTGKGEVIPVEVINDLIFVKATLTLATNKRVEALLNVDTGSGTTALFFNKFASQHRLGELLIHPVEGVNVGHGGEVKALYGTGVSLQIGTQEYRAPFIGVELESASSLHAEFAGSVGAEFFRGYKVTFDIPHRRLILEPKTNAVALPSR
jgi:hypothetical protein